MVGLVLGCVLGSTLLGLLAALIYHVRRPHHNLLGRLVAPWAGQQVTLLVTGGGVGRVGGRARCWSQVGG